MLYASIACIKQKHDVHHPLAFSKFKLAFKVNNLMPITASDVQKALKPDGTLMTSSPKKSLIKSNKICQMRDKSKCGCPGL